MRTLFLFWVVLWPALLFGQEAQRLPDKDYAYIKFGFMREPIVVESFLEHKPLWPGNIQSNPGDDPLKPIVTAVSVGYKAESSINFLTNHFFDFDSDYQFKVHPTDFMGRLSLEWGRSPTKYIFTHYSATNPRPGFRERSARRPTSLPRHSATLYPLAQLALQGEYRVVRFESGVRINVLKFRIEEYNFQSPRIAVNIKRTYEVAPTVFLKMNFGRK